MIGNKVVPVGVEHREWNVWFDLFIDLFAKGSYGKKGEDILWDWDIRNQWMSVGRGLS